MLNKAIYIFGEVLDDLFLVLDYASTTVAVAYVVFFIVACVTL